MMEGSHEGIGVVDTSYSHSVSYIHRHDADRVLLHIERAAYWFVLMLAASAFYVSAASFGTMVGIILRIVV
jgi:hypothetical protein